MTSQIECAKQIAALAKTGLHYVSNPFDEQRYRQILDLAAGILAASSHADSQTIGQLLDLEDGYITPKVDVRGAVFRDDKILLVREAVDGLWTLPGGWADVGDSPSRAVEREIYEESGYQAKAVKLLALEDRKRRHPPSLFEVYKVFFLCTLTGGAAKTSIETTAVDWFAEGKLPGLSPGRVTAGQIHRWFQHCRQPHLPAEFD